MGFKVTCKRAVKYVENHPGVTTRELAESIDHHYRSDASARSALVSWIRRGVLHGIRIKRRGRINRLYPERSKLEPKLSRRRILRRRDGILEKISVRVLKRGLKSDKQARLSSEVNR